jgi:hypothetical protein
MLVSVCFHNLVTYAQRLQDLQGSRLSFIEARLVDVMCGKTLAAILTEIVTSSQDSIT